MKCCTLCKETKPLIEFYFQRPGVYRARCIDCIKVTNRKWYAANREVLQEAARVEYAENEEVRQRYSKYSRDRRAANPEYYAKAWKKWAQNNPECIADRNRRRTAARRGAKVIEKVDRQKVFERDHYRCYICGSDDGPLTVDHIIPITRGGTESYQNSAACCRRCNSRKKDKLPSELTGNIKECVEAKILELAV